MESLKKRNGPFSQKLADGEFAVTVEMVPPQGPDRRGSEKKIQALAALAASGLTDAINLVDASLSARFIYPSDFIAIARERLGWTVETGDPVEFIAHCVSRDQNALALERRSAFHGGLQDPFYDRD